MTSGANDGRAAALTLETAEAGRSFVLYAFVRGAHGEPDRTVAPPPERHECCRVGRTSIGAILGEATGGPQLDVRCHARALAWAQERFEDVLAVRPGCCPGSLDDVEALAKHNHDAIATEMSRLSGLVQVELRFTEAPVSPAPSRTGKDFLASLLPGGTKVSAWGPAAAALDRGLSALARERLIERHGPGLDLIYLMERRVVPEAFRLAEATYHADDLLPVTLLGPTLPLSFARLLLHAPGPQTRDSRPFRPASSEASGGVAEQRPGVHRDRSGLALATFD